MVTYHNSAQGPLQGYMTLFSSGSINDSHIISYNITQAYITLLSSESTHHSHVHSLAQDSLSQNKLAQGFHAVPQKHIASTVRKLNAAYFSHMFFVDLYYDQVAHFGLGLAQM